MPVKAEPKVDVEYWSHLFRLMAYSRDEHKTGYELLNAALEGRPLSEPYVLKLYELAARHFSSGGALDSYHEACLEFLTHNNVPDAEKLLAKAAKPPKPAVVETGIDIQAAMARVTAAGFRDGPGPAGKTWGRSYAVEVLNAALGGEKLTENSCRRLWWAIKALPMDDHFERGRVAEEIAACVCKIANSTAGGFGWNMHVQPSTN